MKTDTYTTSLRSIFTPGIDRFTMGKFQGNHRDLFVSFVRTGDLLTVSEAWVLDAAGTFCNKREKSFSIAQMLRDLRECAAENKMRFDCSDDIPEGFSMATA